LAAARKYKVTRLARDDRRWGEREGKYKISRSLPSVVKRRQGRSECQWWKLPVMTKHPASKRNPDSTGLLSTNWPTARSEAEIPIRPDY